MQSALLAALAGGRSSRFGRDKARALWRGRPLLLHAVDQLRQVLAHPPALQLAPVAVIAQSTDQYTDLGLHCLPDLQPDRGPLGGLHAALVHARATLGPDSRVLLLPCDMVGVRPAWLRQLMDAMQPIDNAVVFADPSARHGCLPLPGLYHVALLDAVELRLQQGELALWRLLDAVATRRVPLPPGWHDQVRGVNTPEDLAQLPDPIDACLPIAVQRCEDTGTQGRDDRVAVEEPLEIRLELGPLGARRVHRWGIAMRTPQDDTALAAGLLWSERILSDEAHLQAIEQTDEHVVVARLRLGHQPNLDAAARHTLATASCGVCGKTSIDQALLPGEPLHGVEFTVPWALLADLPTRLRNQQALFDATGGVHGAGLFTLDGQLLDLAEDVGRHNAVDVLVGRALLRGQLPLNQRILVLSGRVAFELVYKAARAGIAMIVAVGAPSSLAVDLADRAGISLIAFVRGRSGNVYTGPRRVIDAPH